jgi:hypothetical protein
MYNLCGGIRNSRIANGIMNLATKPQDVLVLVKLCEYRSEARPSYSALASELAMSQSEVNHSVRRLQSAGLLHDGNLGEKPILSAVEEYLIHGVKYSFPAEHGRIVRGMPTSYAAEPLSNIIEPGDDPIRVWPDPRGEKRGIALIPLYKSVPAAAKRDPILYARLAMLDAIREGGARVRKVAERELIKNLRKENG